jgi:cytidylate kinase
MAVVTFSGEPGCRADHSARILSQRLGFHFLSEAALRRAVASEYADESAIPDRLFATAVTPILARIAAESDVVLACPGAEVLARPFPNLFRVGLTAPERVRIGAFMLDHGLDRPRARALLLQLEREERALRKRRYGRVRPSPSDLDLACNAETLDADHVAAVVESAIHVKGLIGAGLLPQSVEAELEFDARVTLTRHGISPAAVPASHKQPFANDSEQMFASLLDFYRIPWEYEPRSFPIEWDKDGRVTESFTPDFLLPEFNLYIELTTMKQSLVTRKNRKVKRLRTIYPHINIQVFYQKDFHNLIFKYGLAERGVAV